MNPGTGDPVWRSDSPKLRIAVIAALELEADILRKVLGKLCPGVYVSGPGAVRASHAAQLAIEGGASALVSWGLAGGLQTAALTGSVVLPDRVLSDAGEWSPDPAWRERFLRAVGQGLQPLAGALYSSDRVVTTAAGKASLAARTGAVAVDMESAAIAAVAAAAQLPFLALRVIADGPGDALPDDVERLVTPEGRTRLAGLPRMLVSPRRLACLVRLGARSRQARGILRQLAAPLAGSAR